jgi:hypothetical protein
VDEQRVLDVLAANAVMARDAGGPGSDPLWRPAAAGAPAMAVSTPAGWCWAHVGLLDPAAARRLALVPVELHGAFRHAGGVGLLPVTGQGLRFEAPPAPGTGPVPVDQVPDEVLDTVDRLLGRPLPPAYRKFLATTNGAGPAQPLVCPRFGFVADQPFFGLARQDQHQDVAQAARWLADRFTPDFVPFGYVQGGLLAVKVTGDDIDSIWYWDDDDPRDRESFDANRICAGLLHRCAGSIDELWRTLAQPPGWLVEHAAHWVTNGLIRTVRDETVGAGLPPPRRAPWMASTVVAADPVTPLFEAV